MEKDGQIIENLHLIKQIPTIIIQGRFDMICPPYTAEKVHKNLPNSTLKVVKNAGHAMSEPGISSELLIATTKFKD